MSSSQSSSQFIYVLKAARLQMLTDAATPQENEILTQHVEHLQALARRDVVLLAGRSQTADADTFGIVILRAPSQAAAAELMASDPAVAQGVMTATLFPYQVAAVSPTILD